MTGVQTCALPILEEKTLALVKKYGLEKRIVFSSFLHSSITLLRKLAPEIPCGALVEYDDLGNPGYYCEKFDFQYYHPGVKALTEEMVKSCREHGIPLNVWTINDMGALEQMYEWGVEGVISNYPGVCKGWIDSKKMIKAIDLLEMSPVIAAIKDDAGLKRCLDTECQVVFIDRKSVV